ncbi:Hsp20/alpha crystallin family protein [Bacillaceae bacterium SIJ1]|uniref:Hsp20/alpha crystallin family protein n=1 Tax=Litoribacterium kuwaitense TaxID=1398745 RepID=UPI0013EB32F7|nr:Hsp20/alpha crystallin family protein [Litoribacterium kuwaitense]NGP45917.1 Hsp20/alpha crystallin family protein [Litoribacterium kuwaitense]
MKPIRRMHADNQPIRRIKNELDGLFERFFDDPFFTANPLSNEKSEGVFACNIKEKKDRYVIEAQIPGIDPDDVEIEIENNIITMKGEKKQYNETEESDTEMRVIEHSYGSFQRSFSLPENADTERIRADQKNSILYIDIPKHKESTKRRIRIGKIKMRNGL